MIYLNGTTLNLLKAIDSEIIGGFDCEVPKDVSIHSLDGIAKCSQEAEKVNKPTRSTDFQVLQKSDKLTIKAIFCETYKSTKHSFCGTFSHGLQIGALDVTHVKIKIPEDICKNWHKNKILKPIDMKFDGRLEDRAIDQQLILNGENIYRSYAEGNYLEPDDSDVNCVGTPRFIPDSSNNYSLTLTDQI